MDAIETHTHHGETCNGGCGYDSGPRYVGKTADPDGNKRYRPAGVPWPANELGQYPDRSRKVPAPKVPDCAECGKPAQVGEPGSRRGPVYSQLDMPARAGVVRCPPCMELVRSGEITTKVDGSPVSQFYAAERLITAARERMVKAEAAKDSPAVKRELATIKRQQAVQAGIQRDVSEAIRVRLLATV